MVGRMHECRFCRERNVVIPSSWKQRGKKLCTVGSPRTTTAIDAKMGRFFDRQARRRAAIPSRTIKKFSTKLRRKRLVIDGLFFCSRRGVCVFSSRVFYPAIEKRILILSELKSLILFTFSIDMDLRAWQAGSRIDSVWTHKIGGTHGNNSRSNAHPK